jgi:hypothetical protein
MRGLAVVALLAAACSGAEPKPFDVDVVITDSRVSLWLRDFPEPPCADTTKVAMQFPRPGECTEIGEVDSCPGESDTCLTRVAIESDGIERRTGDLLAWTNLIWFDAHLVDGVDLELVIEGCGAEARIALRGNVPRAPTITDLTTDGMILRGTSDPTGGTGTVALASDGFTTRSCHEASDSSWHVPHPRDPRNTELYGAWAESIVESETVAIPWGEARLWSATFGAQSLSVMLPTWKGDRWEIRDAASVEPVMSVDGVPTASTTSFTTAWGFRETAGGTRVYLSNDTLEYTAGETTDSLTLVGTDGRFSGTFPHVTPTNDLDFGLGADGQVDITLPTVTLTHESNPALTHQVSASMQWRHGLIPRLAP